MPNANDPPAKKFRAYRETSRTNRKLAFSAAKRGDKKEVAFQKEMYRYNTAEAGRQADAFGRGVRAAMSRNKVNRAADKYKKKY